MESVAEVQQAHIKTVKYLQQQQKAGGMDFIILREGIYAESWWLYAGFQDRSFKRLQADPSEITFVIPDDGPIAWVGWDDLGLGTAKILARYPYTEYRNTSLRLTGPRATALSSIARILSSQTGRKVSVNLVGVEEAKRYHKDVKKSVSEDEAWLVDSWVGWFEGIRNGEAALVDPLLGGLLGRDPKGIEEMVEEGGLFGVTD